MARRAARQLEVLKLPRRGRLVLSRVVELDELLERSDYVSLHCPLTPATRHLIGQEQFSKMKSTAFLINTARGGVIDHEALSVALEKREIAGAALDVQDQEHAPVDEAP